MITEAIPTESSVAAQIYAVAHAAYTLEAERIGCTDFPPLRESINELRRSSDSFLVFQSSGSIIGALSFNHRADTTAITRLVVSPAHLRQGIASALILDLERRFSQTKHLTVSTAENNTAAVRFYESHGFTAAARSLSTEGIPLLRLTKSY